MAKSACWSLWPAANPETGWLPAAGVEANAITAAGSDGTDTAARPTGTTEADASAAASTAAEAGAEAAATDMVTAAASGGLPTAADEADAGTRSPDVSLGSGPVVEHDGAFSVSGTPQQAVFQQ